MLAIFWERGAGALSLTVLRLGPTNEVVVAFEENCRFGFQIMDLTGDSDPEICGVYGDLGEMAQLRIFGWDGKQFLLQQELPVTQAHRYMVATSGLKTPNRTPND
jgi:hypothetical protein